MIARPNIDTTLAVALAPLLAAQSAWVRRRALALPEPSGERTGLVGRGPRLRLLVIGDSSAAGVGVDTQDLAWTGISARAMVPRRTMCRICWRPSRTSGSTSHW